MLLLGLIGLPFAVAFAAVFLLGHARLFLMAGLALWFVISIYFLVRDCPEDAYECLPVLFVYFALVGLLGWASGVGAAKLTRQALARDREG